jgi:hypothetical protein
MATTNARSDPVRNFKFHVRAIGDGGDQFGGTHNVRFGFMSVEGISIPYRITPHKLPGRFLAVDAVFRRVSTPGVVAAHSTARDPLLNRPVPYTMEISVRPGRRAMRQSRTGPSGAVLGFRFFNCWTGSVGFSGLNAQDNSIMIHQMQVHHEGFDVFFGTEAKNLHHV